MAGEGTKRIIDLTGRGTRKLPAGFMATAEDLSEEQTARQTADATLDGKITAEAQARLDADNALGDQITALDEKTEADAALIQNPTKTLSGALCSFTDGAEMPMVACTAEIVPKQSGTGTPSPDNVRPISGWESVVLTKASESPLKPSEARTDTINGITFESDGNGNYHLYGTATATVESPIYHIDEFTIPLSSDGWSVYFNNTEANANVNVHFMSPTNTIVDSWGMYELRRNHSTYSAMGGKQCAGLRFYVKVDETVDMWLSPLLLKRADITTTTIPLGRTVYGADAEIVGGSLTDKKGMVDLGTLDWTYDSSSNRFYTTGISELVKRPSDNYEVADSICSAYSVTSLNQFWSSSDGSYAISITGAVSFRNSQYTDATAFKSAMSGVQLVYELVTPTTYQLTPTEIQTLLGENNVWADSGNVEITYRRDISIVINNLESALNG